MNIDTDGSSKVDGLDTHGDDFEMETKKTDYS